MASYLSVKDKAGNFTRYEVPEEVYIYVCQLEAYINSPFQSKLLEAYPERFKEIDFVDPSKNTRLLKLINEQFGVIDSLIGNGCDHGFKPASDCQNEGCPDAELHILFNEIYWSRIIKCAK